MNLLMSSRKNNVKKCLFSFIIIFFFFETNKSIIMWTDRIFSNFHRRVEIEIKQLIMFDQLILLAQKFQVDAFILFILFTG